MKINIGSGENHIEGYLSVDMREETAADIICEIGREPLPLDNDSVSEVWSHHSFEHFPNFIDAVKELARVSKNGCIWKITLPYATTYIYNVVNPYHVNPFFTEDTFRFFEKIYLREQPKEFGLEIIKTEFVYNTELWGEDNDWERLRKTNINVVRSFYQEIRVIKPNPNK